MKKIYSILFLSLCFICSSYAQFKVVKKSGSTPKWINGLELDYIIVSASGQTLNLAKDNAFNRVKENIIKSIADNVRSESKLSKSEVNNEQIYENFTNTISSASGKIDFISGLSLSKVDDFYWEEIKNKKDKSTSFVYHIKYPFPASELQALIDEYKFKDEAISEELDKYVKELNTVSSIEQIKANIDALRDLKKSFIDKRKDITELTIQKYINLVKQADIEEITNMSGLYKFAILINDHRINSSVSPRISSNCAQILSTNKEENMWTVKYDVKDCFEDESNFINISFNFPFANLKRKIFFNVGKSKINLSVNYPIVIKLANDENDNNCEATIKLSSDYSSAFIIESVVLEFNGTNPFRINNINEKFEKAKNYSLKFKMNIDKEKLDSIKSIDLVNGYITYKSVLTGETKTYRIYKNEIYFE